jgi:hypothetical protein
MDPWVKSLMILFKLPYSILFICHHLRSKTRQFIEAASMLGDCHITLSEIHEFQSPRISKYLGKVLLEKTLSKIMAKRLLPHCLILESTVPFWWSTNVWLHLIVDKQCIAPSILLCSLQVAKFVPRQSINSRIP